MPVKLVSLVNSPQTFNLVCMAERVRRDTFEYDPATGHRHRRRGYLRMPRSITLGPKSGKNGRSKLLPDAVADEVEVKNAEKAKRIRVIRVSSDAAVEEARVERVRQAKAARREEIRSVKAEPKTEPKTEPKKSGRSRSSRSTETSKQED